MPDSGVAADVSSSLTNADRQTMMTMRRWMSTRKMFRPSSHASVRVEEVVPSVGDVVVVVVAATAEVGVAEAVLHPVDAGSVKRREGAPQVGLVQERLESQSR